MAHKAVATAVVVGLTARVMLIQSKIIFPGNSRFTPIRIATCRITGLPLAILFWWGVAGVWGILFARLYRDAMNPDGISYLDLANNALTHGPHGLVNAYWSPLYPALIALWELVTRPSPDQEFASVHLLNAVIYFAAAVSFGFFLRELILFRAPERGNLWNQGAFVAFAFALFFYYLNGDIIPWVITPDILLAVIEFTAAALFFRILRHAGKPHAYVALGCVLAVGYYTKSIMLPAGIVLLGILFVCRHRSRKHLRKVLIAAAVMFVVCGPQIVMTSSRVGHVSIGETGRLNYIWCVQRMRQFEAWTGTPGGDMLIHGPRVVMRDPEVLEFGKPISGTYPLGYDPAYWYAGAKVHFDLQEQLAAVRRNLLFYRDRFFDLRYPIAGLIMVLGLSVVVRTKPSAPECWCALWPVALLMMYALLYTEYRYVAPWLILFWVSAYSAVLARNGRAERFLLILLAGVVLVPRVVEFQNMYGKRSQSSDVWRNVVMARDLHQMGIRPGDPIATVGDAFSHHYARIARVHVVAQVTNSAAFWSLPSDTAAAVERAIASTGAKILVGPSRPPEFQSDSWSVVPGTEFSLLPLSKPGD